MAPDTSKTPSEISFALVAGEVCLDFTNTVGGSREGSSVECLPSYHSLLSWSRQAGLISQSEAEALQQTAEGDEKQAASVLERAYALREAIYRIFAAQTLGKQPVSQDLEILNKELEKGITGARVIPTASGFAWEWREQKGVLDCMLGPLARSAATLLTSAERPLVRQCESTSCSWLFVDTTKNHSRVWCRTMICGNKDRARRYRQRQHRQ